MKRLVGAALFVFGSWLDRTGKWCNRKALKLFGFNLPAPPLPTPVPTMMQSMAGGCLDCGSLFAVKAEYEAHRCPNKS